MQHSPNLCSPSYVDYGIGLCLQDPLTHQLHPLVLCLLALCLLALGHVTGEACSPVSPGLALIHYQNENSAQSAGKERLSTGGQLCPFGKGAGCAEVEVGRQGSSCCNVGRWQSRACGAREHGSGEME